VRFTRKIAAHTKALIGGPHTPERMRRILTAGIFTILATTTTPPGAQTQPAYLTPPTVNIEYHIDDASFRLTPLADEAHRVVTELFSTYGITIQRESSLPGMFHVELLADSAYESVLADEIKRDPRNKDTRGFAFGDNRALLRSSAVYAGIKTCPGGVVMDLAEVIAHEIGHLLDLKHLETKELGVDTTNLMDDDTLRVREHACAIPPREITSGTLDVSLTPEQVMTLYDATQRNMALDALAALRDTGY